MEMGYYCDYSKTESVRIRIAGSDKISKLFWDKWLTGGYRELD
jgi:hypothetical protein